MCVTVTKELLICKQDVHMMARGPQIPLNWCAAGYAVEGKFLSAQGGWPCGVIKMGTEGERDIWLNYIKLHAQRFLFCWIERISSQIQLWKEWDHCDLHSRCRCFSHSRLGLWLEEQCITAYQQERKRTIDHVLLNMSNN